jgi:hypothetical protein
MHSPVSLVPHTDAVHHQARGAVLDGVGWCLLGTEAVHHQRRGTMLTVWDCVCPGQKQPPAPVVFEPQGAVRQAAAEEEVLDKLNQFIAGR